jgi:hypothetical protein
VESKLNIEPGDHFCLKSRNNREVFQYRLLGTLFTKVVARAEPGGVPARRE